MSFVATLVSSRGLSVSVHAALLPLLALAGVRWSDAGIGWSSGRSALALGAIIAHAAAFAITAYRRGARSLDVLVLPTGIASRGREAPRGARAVFGIAAAGPLANLALWFALTTAANLAARTAGGELVAVLRAGAGFNLALALLNLLPSFPFVGGRVLRATILPLAGPLVLRHGAAIARTVALVVAAVAALRVHLPLCYLALFAAGAADAEKRMSLRNPAPGFGAAAPFDPEEIIVSPPPYARATRSDLLRAAQRAVRAPFDALYEGWRG